MRLSRSCSGVCSSGIYCKIDKMESGVRKNTLKICFQAGDKVPSNLEVLKFVTGNMMLGAADLHSVYKDENDGSFYVKFMDEPTFTEYCGLLEELYLFTYDDGTRTPVTLVVASRIFRYVRIFNKPPEIDDKTIALVLGQFGTIRQHVRERYSPDCNLNIYNGVRGVHMEVAKEIPAGLYIGHFRARIYYDGLKNRCFHCKQEGHLKSGCPKLANSSSGSGGPRSYSTVAARENPATPNLSVPVISPVMERLVKSVQGSLGTTPAPAPQVIRTDNPEEIAQPVPSTSDNAAIAGESAKESLPNPSTTTEGRQNKESLVQQQTVEVMDTADDEAQLARKRAADSSPDPGAGEDETVEKDGTFQRVSKKRNKRGKRNPKNPLETISTRSKSKPKK